MRTSVRPVPMTMSGKEPGVPLIDRREIEFDATGLLDVLAVMQGRQAFQIPEVRASSVEFDARSHQVTLNYNMSRGTRSIPLRPEVLGAVLVAYCVRARFPMPRKATKGIRVTPRSVILLFHQRFDKLPGLRLPVDHASQPAGGDIGGGQHDLGEVVLLG